MKRNFLNFPKGDFDLAIYRVFSLNRFFEMIQENLLTMIKPEKWDDPLENFLIHNINNSDHKLKILENSHHTFYGQCWTTQRENDALWRIYAPNENGVVVQTTANRLLKVLENHVGKQNAFIGKVRYYKKLVLYKEWSEPEVIRSIKEMANSNVMAKTLMMKLLAFKHEAEVRALVEIKDNNDHFLYKVPIDFKTLFSSIIFDPRMSKVEYKKHHQKLKHLGFRKKIKHSNLYTLHEMHYDKSKLNTKGSSDNQLIF